MRKDYREKLQDIIDRLQRTEGLTRYRISKLSGITEQTISNVMHKRRNLSIEALESLLECVGYEIDFVPIAGGARRTSVPVVSTIPAVSTGAVAATGSSIEADADVLRRTAANETVPERGVS